ncbi:MAG: biotin--[Ruminococcus sp.]|nr:biotin--[acetyl-CoA-carboxylase] ligase [Ruminococcus sp.]MBR4622861.1 biotin--[acetyl-CoA-carboxylase] ligase [Ruminococcus sp.]
MNTRERLAALLAENRGGFVSGEELAKELGCTRGAVWKAVRALQKEGYAISAVTNRGYRLEEKSDMLTAAGIKKYLGEAKDTVFPEVFKSVDSTNTRLREAAVSGACEGTAIIAGAQTAGKGRLGRSFYSPEDTGLYMSLLLRTDLPAEQATLITTAAAAAVAEAVEAASGKKCGIKWVNDVYIGDRKICGILTEASVSLENGGLEYAIVGIGINACEPKGGFPEELREVAAAVFDSAEGDLRNRLAGDVLRRLMRYYRELESRSFLESYRSRLMWKGEKIRVISGESSYSCVLEDVDDSCRLLVRTENGEKKTVLSGEISIRKQ